MIDLTCESDDEDAAAAPQETVKVKKRSKFLKLSDDESEVDGEGVDEEDDKKTTAFEEEEEEEEAPVAEAATSRAAPAPADSTEPTSRACPWCGAPCEVRVSRSAKNPGRKYFKCAAAGARCPDDWLGWCGAEAEASLARRGPAAGAAGGAGAGAKKKNVGCAGSSYASIRAAEATEMAGAAKRARARLDDHTSGHVVGFDRAKRIVSKEAERKDPKAFKPLTAAAVVALQRQAPSAEEVRNARLARFGH